MKLKTTTEMAFKVTEGKRYLSFRVDDFSKMTDFDSNLPYEKSIDDWDFYSKAIKRILKEIDKYEWEKK